MKYAHVLEQLYSKPWLITASGHAAVRQLVESRLGELALSVEANREGVDICGAAVELPQMRIEEGLAIIPIGGIIGQGLSKIQKGYGAVGVEDIEADLDVAMADDSVRGIILDFDSPGGTVGGVNELADKIAAIQHDGKKKIVAFTRGQMASAAYWLACGANAIAVSPTSELGSIGVYLPWVDQSKRFSALGYSVEIFKSGKYKGMGYPGTSLSDDQRALLQDGVDQLFKLFAAGVKKYRAIKDADMQGQTFLGARALENGFADAMASSIADVRRKFFK